ncbi:MAG: hypothetical protein CMC35_04440 [Flavobacteriaceae bacterium]|nr:hypothetical protein [Flavobacteriaceae bacterium]|tara:strand:+ start:6721 stop:7257 length:537 start_codon:yes stop_codon:yes gene_type:complete
MKQCIAVFLIASLILPVSGTFLWLKFQQQHVRKEVKHQLMANVHEDDLKLLAFSKEDSERLQWKHDKEFEFQGVMYDIVSTTEKNDSLYYRVFPDKKETKLNRQLEKLATDAFGKDPLQQEKQRQLSHFFSILFFTPLETWTPWESSEFTAMQYNYANTFHSIVLLLDDPPPKHFLHT